MLNDLPLSAILVSPKEFSLLNSGISRTGINLFSGLCRASGLSRKSSSYFSLNELLFLKNAVGVGSEYLSKTDVYFFRSAGPIFF